MEPSTFLPIVGGLLGRGSGGAKATATAQNALSVSVNPTIANVFGPGTVSPSTYAPISGSPSASAQANEGGSDPYGFLPRGNAYSVPVRPGASYLTGPQGQMIGAGLFGGSGNDDLLLLLIIGAGLWFATQQ